MTPSESQPVTTMPGATSGLHWQEGTEGLQFVELCLGGMASTYLGRGRSGGYGLYFTSQRVIGVRMRLLAQALLAPYLIVISRMSSLTALMKHAEHWGRSSTPTLN